jgi:hypothetical protein
MGHNLGDVFYFKGEYYGPIIKDQKGRSTGDLGQYRNITIH